MANFAQRQPSARCVATLLLIAIALLAPAQARADEPDYGVPGQFLLPWCFGEGYRVTWTPADHWLERKATGVAFDVSMPEGIVVCAPADGHAYFLQDNRPLETNLGNYIDLVVGNTWLVRLAHLRDVQTGSRDVHVGELIGYSGSSGAMSAHLHIEILVRGDDGWVCPDLARLQRIFNLPLEDLQIGLILTNSTPTQALRLMAPVRSPQGQVTLGQDVNLVVPLLNTSEKDVHLNTVQLALRGPAGRQAVAEARGDWLIEAGATVSVTVPFAPEMSGVFELSSAVCQSADAAYRLPIEGRVEVARPLVRLVGVSVQPSVAVGEPLSLDVWVENPSDSDVVYDDLTVSGVQPGGARWTAIVGTTVRLPHNQVSQFAVSLANSPSQVGEWRISEVGYRSAGHDLTLALVNQAFQVAGPELIIDDLGAYRVPGGLDVLIKVSNVGTHTAHPERFEVWGWTRASDNTFNSIATSGAPLEPGQTTLILFHVRLRSFWNTVRLTELGYWMEGRYMTLQPPDRLATAAIEAGSSSQAEP